MGLIRKSLSIATWVVTPFPGVIQYRSDTERGTYQTKLLREEQERANEIAYQALLEAKAQNEIIRNELANQSAQKNDGGNQAVVPSSSPAAPSDTLTPLAIATALGRLHDLQVRGLLSSNEYMDKKAELLNQLVPEIHAGNSSMPRNGDSQYDSDQLAIEAVEKLRSLYAGVPNQ